MGFDITIFLEQLFSPVYLQGAMLSLGVAVVSLIIATVIGFIVAIGRDSKSAFARSFALAFTWFFRAIPALLVLLIMWNALPQLLPFLRGWYNPFIAASVGLGLVEAAFMAEIIRSSLSSVDEGQGLAGRALGMKPGDVMRRILVPQAIRIALPPTTNEFIGLIKYSSLASVISLRELLTTAQVGVNITFRYAEYYSVAIIYYLVIVSVITVIQMRIERRFHWASSTPTTTKRRGLKLVGAAR